MRLELESEPECVTLVRGALTGLGEKLAFDPELLDDVKTAVTEACSNVVLHAYDGGAGPIAVTVEVGRDRVEAAVHDRGSGIRTVSSSDDRMGVGLTVISALAERAEFVSSPGEGTEVRMAFAGHVAGAPAELSETLSVDGVEPARRPDHVRVWVAPPSLLAPVLGRVVNGLAARAHFSVDRLRALQQLADLLGTHAGTAAAGGKLNLTLSAATRRLKLAVGPFRNGSSADIATDLAALVDDASVATAPEGETLHLVVSEQR